MRLNGCPDEPVDISFDNCKICAREGAEGVELVEGKAAKRIYFENVTLENFADPLIKCNSSCQVGIFSCPEIKIENIEKIENEEKYYV